MEEPLPPSKAKRSSPLKAAATIKKSAVRSTPNKKNKVKSEDEQSDDEM
jgi:hypothetical protein